MKEGTTTSNFDLHDYDTIKTPNYVGGYRLGIDSYVQFNLTHKPNWFHRTMMRLCFGYKWVNL
jgi:hypothetical protein